MEVCIPGLYGTWLLNWLKEPPYAVRKLSGSETDCFAFMCELEDFKAVTLTVERVLDFCALIRLPLPLLAPYVYAADLEALAIRHNF
jgi:hypothetical protein